MTVPVIKLEPDDSPASAQIREHLRAVVASLGSVRGVDGRSTRLTLTCLVDGKSFNATSTIDDDVFADAPPIAHPDIIGHAFGLMSGQIVRDHHLAMIGENIVTKTTRTGGGDVWVQCEVAQGGLPVFRNSLAPPTFYAVELRLTRAEALVLADHHDTAGRPECAALLRLAAQVDGAEMPEPGAR